MILTATALFLAFLWSSALRSWFSRLFARPPTIINIHNYSEVQLAGVDRSQQSSTMVALLIETGVADQMPAVASSSGGSGPGKGIRPSSASSALVSSHVNSLQGGSATSSDIHGSSTVHSKITGNGNSTRRQQQQQQRRRASSQKQQETHPIQEPTTESLTRESADGRKQKKKKRQGAASGGSRREGEG